MPSSKKGTAATRQNEVQTRLEQAEETVRKQADMLKTLNLAVAKLIREKSVVLPEETRKRVLFEEDEEKEQEKEVDFDTFEDDSPRKKSKGF